MPEPLSSTDLLQTAQNNLNANRDALALVEAVSRHDAEAVALLLPDLKSGYQSAQLIMALAQLVTIAMYAEPESGWPVLRDLWREAIDLAEAAE